MPFQTFSLHQLGWRPQYAHASTLDDFEAGYPARVTAVRRGSVALLCSRGAGTAALAWQLAGAGIVPGDWVMVERTSGRVTRVLPRQSWLGRAQGVAAANLDTVFVPGGFEPRLDVPRLQRGLALARAGGITPVLVLEGAGRDADVHARLDALRRWLPAAAVVALDGADPAGLARLAPWLAPGSTVAVLGGASALAARLAGPGGVRHGALSVTAGGAWVIDTPTLRALAAHDEMEEAGARVKRVAAQSTCSYIA